MAKASKKEDQSGSSLFRCIACDRPLPDPLKAKNNRRKHFNLYQVLHRRLPASASSFLFLAPPLPASLEAVRAPSTRRADPRPVAQTLPERDEIAGTNVQVGQPTLSPGAGSMPVHLTGSLSEGVLDWTPEVVYRGGFPTLVHTKHAAVRSQTPPEYTTGHPPHFDTQIYIAWSCTSPSRQPSPPLPTNRLARQSAASASRPNPAATAGSAVRPRRTGPISRRSRPLRRCVPARSPSTPTPPSLKSASTRRALTLRGPTGQYRGLQRGPTGRAYQPRAQLGHGPHLARGTSPRVGAARPKPCRGACGRGRGRGGGGGSGPCSGGCGGAGGGRQLGSSGAPRGPSLLEPCGAHMVRQSGVL
jgi:hypothetical protein